MADWHPTEHELNRALCNFCNQAGDPFKAASQWDEYVWDACGRLSEAYNAWYVHLKDTKGDHGFGRAKFPAALGKHEDRT